MRVHVLSGCDAQLDGVCAGGDRGGQRKRCRSRDPLKGKRRLLASRIQCHPFALVPVEGAKSPALPTTCFLNVQALQQPVVVGCRRHHHPIQFGHRERGHVRRHRRQLSDGRVRNRPCHVGRAVDKDEGNGEGTCAALLRGLFRTRLRLNPHRVHSRLTHSGRLGVGSQEDAPRRVSVKPLSRLAAVQRVAQDRKHTAANRSLNRLHAPSIRVHRSKFNTNKIDAAHVECEHHRLVSVGVAHFASVERGPVAPKQCQGEATDGCSSIMIARRDANGDLCVRYRGGHTGGHVSRHISGHASGHV
eukprot:Rhum_TRINITY_DN13100_c0_g1::Rhum_TRINITY_DN13100_c0_g1_i1::g.57013::m.57013